MVSADECRLQNDLCLNEASRNSSSEPCRVEEKATPDSALFDSFDVLLNIMYCHISLVLARRARKSNFFFLPIRLSKHNLYAVFLFQTHCDVFAMRKAREERLALRSNLYLSLLTRVNLVVGLEDFLPMSSLYIRSR